MDDDSEKKKAKETKKCVIKRRLMFKDYKGCLFNGTVILRPQQRFKSDYHEVYTEKVNKIALSSNDNKRLQAFNRVATRPYGTNAYKVYKSEMENKYDNNKILKIRFKYAFKACINEISQMKK